MRSVTASDLPEFDARLFGTWKSDRRKTFKNFRPKPRADPAALKRLKAMFGNLTIRWGKGKYYTEFGGHRDSVNYEIIGRDSDSVVIRYKDALSRQARLLQIHFEGDYYWISLGSHLVEYFRKVRPSRRASSRS